MAMDGNYENTTRVTTDRVVKCYSRKERFAAEFRALTMLHGSGLAPEIIAWDPDVLSITMERVEGARATVDHITMIGTALRELHDVARDRCREDLASVDISTDLVNRIDRRLAAIYSTVPYERWNPYLHVAPGVARQSKPTLCQHDLKFANVIITQHGARFIDFDQSRFGNPLSDLGKGVWRMSEQSAHRDALLHSYFGRAATDEEIATVEFFEVAHAVGALAYWCEFDVPAYWRHARTAQEIVRVRIDPDLDVVNGGH